ncbi:LacI family DNA-binding transcriptional regulator [Arthrobacter agilis]|uniref:LacI family DNA-binding transcriptional regulator n=1 Tax=Arthrobacter agilis TaxID=37921 RepID=UPI002365DD66|nr:LacI family DNA-binding transcriptional regulator [Arthrobacter agilis]WDF33063.1 LacI family DNA-binding transcriptional regulator [Arthrobacter agilis]
MAKETIAGLAKRLGISKASVSYALNGQPGVSEVTRRRVLDLAEELDWYPSSSARALSRSRAGAVGMVLSADPLLIGTEPYYMGLLAGIESALAEGDMALMLRMVGKDPLQEHAIYERWSGERKVDGVLLFDHLHDDPRPALLERLGLPFVLHSAPESARPTSFSGTTTDHDSDSARIVDHLHATGHRSIAHVSGPHSFVHEEERIRGVCERADGYGMTVVQYEGNYALEAGHDAIALLLRTASAPPITAVVLGNDLMSMGALLALRELGLRCPEDVAIVSWDDSLHCQLASPSVTALSRNTVLQGRVAAELLLLLLDSGTLQTRSMPSSELVVRASTGG